MDGEIFQRGEFHFWGSLLFGEIPLPGESVLRTSGWCRFLPVEKLESCQSASFAGGLFMAGWGGAEVCGDRPVWAPLKAS